MGDRIAVAGVLLLAVLVLGPAWLQPTGMIYGPQGDYSDLTITFWPNMLFNLRTWRDFQQVPLWRPLIMAGAPYLGNPQSGVFYPPNWAFMLLPINLGFNLLIIAHVAWTGWGMYRLQRRAFDVDEWPAFLSAAVWMLTPKLFGHLGAGHIGMVYALSWWPWVVLEGLKAWQGRAPAHAWFSGAFLAMQWLNHPQIGALTAGTLTLLLLYRVKAERDISPLKTLWPLIPATLLLAAPLWVPLIALTPYLTRASAETIQTLTLPQALLGLFIGQRSSPHESTVYLGVLPLYLAPLAWTQSRGRAVFLLGLVGICGALIGQSISWLGPLMRVPSRSWFVMIFAASLLSGWGAKKLVHAPFRSSQERWTVLAVSGGFAGALFGVGIGLASESLASPGTALAVFAVLSTAWLLLALYRRLPPRYLWIVAICLVSIDLALVDSTLWRVVRREEAFQAGRQQAELLVERLRDENTLVPWRIYSPSYSIPHHVAALYGLHQLDGVDPIQLADYRRFMALAGGYDDHGYTVTIPPFREGEELSQALADARPRPDLLGLLNCRYVVAAFPIEADGLVLWRKVGQEWIYENSHLLPRAWTTTDVQTVQDSEEAFSFLSAGFDVSTAALVENGTPLGGPPGLRAVQLTHYTPNRIEVHAETGERALLTLSEVWTPGWRVWVDGVRSHVYRVNGILRGVYLEPGAHTVVWRYQPASLRWGLIGAACGLALTVVILAMSRGRPD